MNHAGWWRWRESNPRLPSSQWDFSERSRWFDVGRVAGHRHPAVAPSSLGVLAGPEALPASEPLSMTPRPSERQARGGRATRFLYAAIAMLSLAFVLLPALSRRSGDVGSLLPPRSSRSKPRTPLSSPHDPVRARLGR